MKYIQMNSDDYDDNTQTLSKATKDLLQLADQYKMTSQISRNQMYYGLIYQDILYI